MNAVAAQDQPRVDNFAAAVAALKDMLPYLLLFYGIDVFLWYQGTPGRQNDASLVFNIMISSLFIAGFWAIGFFRIRARMKAPRQQPQVIVVQQPIYMPPPPGYAYPPYPPPGADGNPQALPPLPPQPPQQTQARRPPPEGSA